MKNHKSQQGVTLLLAVLMITGMTLVTLAVGSFAIQELRASRAVSLTEPAIGAAETAGEQGLWVIKRSGTLTACDPTNVIPPDKRPLSAGSSSFIQTCKKFSDAVFNIKGGTPFNFYLYDPNDINGDIDLQGEKLCSPEPPSTNPAGFLYNSITATQLSGSSSVSMTVKRMDAAATLVASQLNINSQPVSLAAVLPCSEGRMVVTLQSTADASVDVTTNLGMPEFPTVDGSGCNSKNPIASCSADNQDIYTRRINVVVPQ